MAERKLATTARIVSITPIDGADAIETARVRGWDVVVGKGQYSPGDLVVFFEIDIALPLSNPAFTKFGERSKKILPDGTRLTSFEPSSCVGKFPRDSSCLWKSFNFQTPLPPS